MPDHAGYATVVTIRDQVFNGALLSAWHSGRIRHSLFKTIQETPAPTGSVNLFFEAPHARFVPFNRVDGILRINGWGTISLRLNPFPAPSETKTIEWQADLLITPTASSIGTVILLSAKKVDYRLINWQFDVLSGTPFSAAAEAYLTGSPFKNQLQTWLQDAIGDLLFPIVDFSYLGPFSGISFTTIDVQCVDEALILGFNIDNGEFATAGDRAALHNFAEANDVAVVVNPDAIKAMMPNANQMVQDQIDQYDATLERLDITCEEGRFRVTGRASMTGGAANFSLAAVPRMTYGRPGANIPLYKKTMVVKGRSWLALSFVPAEPHVDIDRSDWVVLVETSAASLAAPTASRPSDFSKFPRTFRRLSELRSQHGRRDPACAQVRRPAHSLQDRAVRDTHHRSFYRHQLKARSTERQPQWDQINPSQFYQPRRQV